MTDNKPTQEEVEQAVERPFAYAYRYPDAVRFNTGGDERNGNKPVEVYRLYTEAQLQIVLASHADLTARLAEVGKQLEFDRTKVAECITAAKKAVSSRDWLTEGRGPYKWNDDNWHKEFMAAAEEFLAALKPLAKIAADWSNCPTKPEAIAQARIDLEAERDSLKRQLDKCIEAIGVINGGEEETDDATFKRFLEWSTKFHDMKRQLEPLGCGEGHLLVHWVTTVKHGVQSDPFCSLCRHEQEREK